jgi:hypothetical protein
MPPLARNRTPAHDSALWKYKEGVSCKGTVTFIKPYVHLSHQRQQMLNTTQGLKGTGPSSEATFSDAAFHRGIKMTTMLTRACHLCQSRARRIQFTPYQPFYRRPISYHPIHDIFHAVFLPSRNKTSRICLFSPNMTRTVLQYLKLYL